MTSFKFPNMLSNTASNIITDNDATYSNLKLLLLSPKGSLFGDPYYGTKLRNILFEQNSNLLVDIIKDEIFTDIFEFIPQLECTRNDITISSKGTAIYCTIKCKNKLNGEVNLYTIKLLEDGED